MHTKYAEMARQLINTTTVRGADVEAVTAVKQWLAKIANGRLAVCEVSPMGRPPEEAALLQPQAE